MASSSVRPFSGTCLLENTAAFAVNMKTACGNWSGRGRLSRKTKPRFASQFPALSLSKPVVRTTLVRPNHQLFSSVLDACSDYWPFLQAPDASDLFVEPLKLAD